MTPATCWMELICFAWNRRTCWMEHLPPLQTSLPSPVPTLHTWLVSPTRLTLSCGEGPLDSIPALGHSSYQEVWFGTSRELRHSYKCSETGLPPASVLATGPASPVGKTTIPKPTCPNQIPRGLVWFLAVNHPSSWSLFSSGPHSLLSLFQPMIWDRFAWICHDPGQQQGAEGH